MQGGVLGRHKQGESGVSEGQVQNRGPGNGVKRKVHVHRWGIEKEIWSCKHGVEVQGKESIVPVRKGAEGIGESVVKIEVPHNQMRVGEWGENTIGGY